MNSNLKRPNRTRDDDCFIALRDKQGDIVGHAICSAQDFACLSMHTWWRSSSTVDDWYPVTIIKGKNIRMHKYVMNIIQKIEITDGMVIDHKNRVRYDNHRENLRLVTKSQNAQNRPKKEGTSSIYNGISYVTKAKKFMAKVRHNKQTIFIGYFETEIEAVEAYDRYLAHNSDIHKKMNNETLRNKYRSEPLIHPKKKKTNKNKFIGVSKNGENKFRAQIQIDGKTLRIAITDTENEAAIKYDEYIVRHGLQNRLNFPQNYPDYVPNRVTKTTIVSEIDSNTVQISLNGAQQECALIDKEDYEKVKYMPCSINSGYVNIYNEGVAMRLSRYLMNEKREDIVVDHINGNRVDNRKSNLRAVSRKLNAQNKSKHKDATSIYMGVMKNKNTWRVVLRHEGKFCYYKTEILEIDAALRRDLFILTDSRFVGSCYKLNFDWKRVGVDNEINDEYIKPPFDDAAGWVYKKK